MTTPTIALVGNPNVGKSTVFNALTGSRQHVGNWPGKTVEKKEGIFRSGDVTVSVIDLPGIYSLSAYSLEEQITRDFIVREKPALVVDVVDAANLERNLYLTAQILETGIPVVVALNMGDIAASRGFKIDFGRLSELLGDTPVIPMSAARSEGIDRLQQAILDYLDRGETSFAKRLSSQAALQALPTVSAPHSSLVRYPADIESSIARIRAAIEGASELAVYDPRWLAIQLLEEDRPLLDAVHASSVAHDVVPILRDVCAELRHHYGDDVDVAVAEHRYAFVHGLVKQVLTRSIDHRITTSDRIDRIVTNRVLGIPIFLVLMWIVFKVTTDVAAPFQDWVGTLFSGPITNWIGGLTLLLGLAGTWVENLLVDGVIAGVGGVLVFLPVLMLLYLVLGLLEESGYMARVAFVMDELMHVVGLPGKSFVPMVIGFGCTVPALFATRTLDSERDRVLTGLLVPFMSCGARLPVYVLMAGIFFPEHSGGVIFGLYLLGIVIAIAIGFVLKGVLFRDQEESAFVMELPLYRMPSLRGIWFHMWSRISEFLHNATTIVLAASCVIWLLLAIPIGPGRFAETSAGQNVFGMIARGIAPVLAPLGFGSWESAGALMSGFVAKEVVVSTMSQMYGGEGGVAIAAAPAGQSSFFGDVGIIVTSFLDAILETLKAIPSIVGLNLFGVQDVGLSYSAELATGIRLSFERASGGHPELAAVAFMVFVLLYTPCIASLAAEKQELGARWMWVSIVGQLMVAWTAAFIVFQGGVLLGLG
jgi:ferrous iron transport protein B